MLYLASLGDYHLEQRTKKNSKNIAKCTQQNSIHYAAIIWS